MRSFFAEKCKRGMVMNEKIHGGEIRYENRLTKWFHNYWYYYKWPVIGISFALIVVLICTLQMCGTVSADVNLLYAGSYNFVGEGAGKLESAVAGLLPEDYNGDGRKTAAAATLMVYSEAEIADRLREAEEAGEEYVVNAVYFAKEKQKFNQLLMSGEYSIFLIADWLYEETKGTDIFLPLTDALGSRPENAYDDCAMRLSDTAFGQYFSALQNLPDNTLICFRRQGSIGTLLNADRANADYRDALEAFRALMQFSAE